MRARNQSSIFSAGGKLRPSIGVTQSYSSRPFITLLRERIKVFRHVPDKVAEEAGDMM